MERRGRIIPVIFVLSLVLLLAKPVVADPPGFTADQGTVDPGDYYAWVKSGYSSVIWTYVSCSETYGDYYVKGHSALGSYTIDYYVVIKIKPQDTTLDYVELKVESEFKYGISAGFASTAAWTIQYVVMDMGQNPPYAIGWSAYGSGDSVSYSYKDSKTYSTPADWKPLYDTTYFTNYEPIDPNDWNYVGVWIRCGLVNNADLYRTTLQQGNAWYNPTAIHFRFF